jgi:hypothetical protein
MQRRRELDRLESGVDLVIMLSGPVTTVAEPTTSAN